MQRDEYGKYGQEGQSCTLGRWCLIMGIELTSEDYESIKLMAKRALENTFFEEGMKLEKIDRIKEIFISRFF